MKKRNIKIITALAIVASLSTGVIAVHAETIADNSVQSVATQEPTNVSNIDSQKAINSKSLFLPKDAETAVKLWAEGLKIRDASFRYAILSEDLKKQEYENFKNINWVIGGSSPWVLNYEVTQTNKVDDETYEYRIDYTLSDSTKTAYSAHENITVKKGGDNWFVTKYDNYGYMPDVTENTDLKFTEVKKKEIDNALVPRDKESIVKLWAEALKERNGAFRYAVLTKDLKDQEYDKYANMKWVIGGSSPKVVSYEISEKNKIDDKTSEYEIKYTLTDSTKAIYYATETLTVSGTDIRANVIKHDDYDYLPNINSVQ